MLLGPGTLLQKCCYLQACSEDFFSSQAHSYANMPTVELVWLIAFARACVRTRPRFARVPQHIRDFVPKADVLSADLILFKSIQWYLIVFSII